MNASIRTALEAFAAHLSGTPGVVSVHAVVPAAALPDEACPALVLDVRAPASEITTSRRTLLWPVDVYCFATKQTSDRAADLGLALQFYDDLVARIDQSVTLGGVLGGTITYPDPIGTDPGPMPWDGKNYVGFVLFPILPTRVEKRFGT